MELDREILDGWLTRGLCGGPGDGDCDACLQQAVSLALGLGPTDHPEDVPGSCINLAVAAFARTLNDGPWSSPAARGAGLRGLAYAQLGTAAVLDGPRWVARLTELIIREVLPIALRAATKMHPEEEHREMLEAAAVRCERDGDEATARDVASSVYRVGGHVLIADAVSYAADAADVSDDAVSRADAVASAASSAVYAAAYAARAIPDAKRDEVLALSASLAVRAIREQVPA